MVEGLALDAVWLFAAFLILLVLVAVGLAARRFLLERGGATIECGLRKGSGPWRLGVASYQLDELRWFSAFRVSMRPEETFPRRDLAVVSRRPATEAETSILGQDRIVVECQLGEPSERSQSDKVELALAESALTGLLVWLEAAPPGSHLGLAL